MGKMWGSNVPLIGKSLTKWGKVGQILAQPCTPSPELWVYASWKGIATAIWSLGKPTALGQHGSPASMSVFGKHGRTTPKNSPGPRYRWNGELMPGPEIQWPQGEGWAMWKIPVMLVRTAGWYLLVYDALANGALAWTSQTYKYGGCPDPTQPFFWGLHMDWILGPGAQSHLFAFSPSQSHGVTVDGSGVHIDPGRDYVIAANCTSKQTQGLPYAPCSLTIRNSTTGQSWNSASPTSPKTGGGMSAMAVARGQAGSAIGGEQISFDLSQGGGWSNVKGSLVYVQINKSDNLLPDP